MVYQTARFHSSQDHRARARESNVLFTDTLLAEILISVGETRNITEALNTSRRLLMSKTEVPAEKTCPIATLAIKSPTRMAGIKPRSARLQAGE
jgi:hypothetical protein